jgi:uncharacterized repeat protein (TIGR03806 family)
MLLGMRSSAFWLLIVACSDSVPVAAPPTNTADAAASDATTVAEGGPDTGAADAGPVRAPFGYDTRPKNETCVAWSKPNPGGLLKVEKPFPLLRPIIYPVGMAQAPNDPMHVYTWSHQQGTILRFDKDPTVADYTTVITLPIAYENEVGLLGVAFDPSYLTNRAVYVYYGATGGAIGKGYRMVVARLFANSAGDVFTFDREILSFDVPSAGHVGGSLAFGKDGNLYLAPGDGGVEPTWAQDPTRLHGKVLRIHPELGAAYTIPPTNPFAVAGGRPEIYALGLRNPYGFSFDSQTGDLWLGDVGEGTNEEIDRIELGGNYGWPIREGTRCTAPAACGTGLIDPVHEYLHGADLAVVGGRVYRGSAIPWLIGHYVFADYFSGRIWTLDTDANGKASAREIANVAEPISSIGVDLDGELYVTMFYGWDIRKLVQNTSVPSTVPTKLSATGCADSVDPRKFTAGQIPYGVRSPFWSDGADKLRALALPDPAVMSINSDGDFDLPIGSVLRKDFLFDAKRVETRLFMRHADGSWAGYTYAWDDAERDATLVQGGRTQTLRTASGDRPWVFPSEAQCVQCHTQAAGRTLGLELRQLQDMDQVYARTGRISDQVATLEHIGMFAAPPAKVTPLEDPNGSGPVDARARSYLHSNCSGCHRPQGPGRGTANYMASVPWSDVHACNAELAEGDLGVTGSKVVVPGRADLSALLLRMRALDVHRMPPIASRAVDTKGTQLMEQWIRGLGPCP